MPEITSTSVPTPLQPELNGHVEPLALVQDTPHLTDRGNALRLVRDHGNDLRYCWPWKRWLVWDCRRWQIDDTGEATARSKETIVNLYLWAAAEVAVLANKPLDEEKTRRMGVAEATIKHCLKSEQAQRVNGMLDLTRSEQGIPVLPVELDQGNFLLNCANGTLDLTTGVLRDHNRDDLLTKLCPTAYRHDATCPAFLRFLDEIFQATSDSSETAGDTDLIGYVQRLLGYCLTGDVREQILPIFWGGGSNGKSTLLNVLQEVLGKDFAIKAPPHLLVSRRSEAHPTERATLFGKRLVIAMETEASARLAEAIVKELTGSDPVPARRMREDFWEFIPTHKLILCTNHKPKVTGTDHAIWRRLRLIPFTVTIPDERQDKTLPDRLREEAEGILAWLVRGCLDWQRCGLGTASRVTTATSDYKSEQDLVASFLAECCLVTNPVDPAVCCLASDLYASFKSWCERSGEDQGMKIPTQKVFGLALTERGFERKFKKATWYLGLGLHPKDHSEGETDFN